MWAAQRGSDALLRPTRAPTRTEVKRRSLVSALTPFLCRGIAILGLAMSPGGLLRETRSNLATLSFFYADFLTVSPIAVTLLLTNRAAAPASLAPRREKSLRKRTIWRRRGRPAQRAPKRRHSVHRLCPRRGKWHVGGRLHCASHAPAHGCHPNRSGRTHPSLFFGRLP